MDKEEFIEETFSQLFDVISTSTLNDRINFGAQSIPQKP
jgi:hypothetical protein